MLQRLAGYILEDLGISHMHISINKLPTFPVATVSWSPNRMSLHLQRID